MDKWVTHSIILQAPFGIQYHLPYAGVEKKTFAKIIDGLLED